MQIAIAYANYCGSSLTHQHMCWYGFLRHGWMHAQNRQFFDTKVENNIHYRVRNHVIHTSSRRGCTVDDLCCNFAQLHFLLSEKWSDLFRIWACDKKLAVILLVIVSVKFDVTMMFHASLLIWYLTLKCIPFDVCVLTLVFYFGLLGARWHHPAVS